MGDGTSETRRSARASIFPVMRRSPARSLTVSLVTSLLLTGAIAVLPHVQTQAVEPLPAGRPAAAGLSNGPLIWTAAGNGTAGITGDAGPALHAELDQPWVPAVDPEGNTGADSSTPVPVQSGSSACPLTGAAQVSAGYVFSVVLQSDGTVCDFGHDNYGQLGGGTTTDSSQPVQVLVKSGGTPLSGVTQLSAGYHFTLALCGGEVYAWGDGQYGNLGGGTTGNSSTPQPVLTGPDAPHVPISGVTQIAAGNNNGLALLSNGTVESWGNNNYGQLGNDKTTSQQAYSSYAVPVEFTDGTPVAGVASIAEGPAFDAYVVGMNGSVYAFGSDGSGQWGTGTSGGKSDTPVLIGSGANEVVAGSGSTLESLPGGQVVGFGANASGQLGVGSSASIVSTPASVAGVTGVGEATTGATFAYDGDGLRISESAAGLTTQFTSDQTGGLPELLSEQTVAANGNAVDDDSSNDFVYGPDGLAIEQVNTSTGVVDYFFHDALGSTRALLSTSGAVAATFSYNAYGALTGSQGSVATPLLYAGGYYDAAIKSYYLVHRYYDPQTGEFLTVDPLVGQTQQAYSYAGGDPVNGSDPSGMAGLPPEPVCSGVVRPPPGETQHQACQGQIASTRKLMASECASSPGTCGDGCPSYVSYWDCPVMQYDPLYAPGSQFGSAYQESQDPCAGNLAIAGHVLAGIAETAPFALAPESAARGGVEGPFAAEGGLTQAEAEELAAVSGLADEETAYAQVAVYFWGLPA
jgi:RHS repeat-associated protein